MGEELRKGNKWIRICQELKPEVEDWGYFQSRRGRVVFIGRGGKI